MALPTEAQRPFRLYVTHVDGEAHFLKISGQLDRASSLMVNSLLETATENFEKGIGAVPPAAIHEGIICAAKYKETYYRVKIISTANLATGLVVVHYIDYGNKAKIPLSAIRFLDSYDPMFLQLRGQATDYYLSRVIHPSGRWDECLLLEIQSQLFCDEYPASVAAQTDTLSIISIQFKGNDLSTHLVSNRYGIALPVPKQEVLLLKMTGSPQGQTSWSPSLLTEHPSFTEHVPFLNHQNFPNPSSAMRINLNGAVPYNGTPIQSGVSQILLDNIASRNLVNLRTPVCQPQHAQNITMPATPPSTPIILNKPPSPKKPITYKIRSLEVNSQHKVFVSFAEEGPQLFAVQLVSDAKKLQEMMVDINSRTHSNLAEPPMIGNVCLGRISPDRIMCRAIVMNISGSQCQLFFVDFGDTEMVSYYDIFDIPEEFVKPIAFAMRFCLSGVKKFHKSPYLIEAFKQLVNGKNLTLRVVAPEGPPLIQYVELYLDNKNVLDLLMVNMKDNLQFKWIEMLPLASRQPVFVSYVDSCIKFYVQLSDKIDELNAVMAAVKSHCENSSSPGKLAVGSACCARFPADDNWYRAMVRGSRRNKVVVVYVDYGNEQEVDVNDLRTITPDLMKLPAQVLKCALKGYEYEPVESETSNQLEMIALEKTLIATVMGVLCSDTMLVSLVDDTVTPPLDVARRIMQLTQSRRNAEIKAQLTPPGKDASETFSSPEGSVPDDNKKSSFQREKSFKEERRRDCEEFSQRGGSFRFREQREGSERAGAGGHSDEYAARSDRGDRLVPNKPWEQTNTMPVVANYDDWEEPQPTQNIMPPSRPNTDKYYRERDRFNQDDEHKTDDRGNRRSERRFRSQDGRERRPLLKKFNQVQCKELSNPVPLETPFKQPTLEIGSQQEVSVTWIISPKKFYIQILSLQPKFLDMMHKIPQLYKGIRPYTGNVTVGASVLARYLFDGVLYRATIVSILPFSKFLVRYVDFGNKELVNAWDIWQMAMELMELPKMAVHCSLTGVGPKDCKWKANPDIDLCFNAPRYQCIFQECNEEQCKVSLWNNGVSVADMLVEKQLAVMCDAQASVTLKDEATDLTTIAGQQILGRVTHVESFEKFQPTLDKADLVENAIANFDRTKLTVVSEDNLAIWRQ